MKRIFVIGFLVFNIFLSHFGANAQSKKEVLTNEKIIELVKLGLGEPIIIQKIRQSDCQCDTSTIGLSKLKAAKLSDAIILTILESGSDGQKITPSENKKLSSPDVNKVVPAEVASVSLSEDEMSQLKEPGIYLSEDGLMKTIEPSVFSGTKMGTFWGGITSGIVKSKWRAKVRGNSANLRSTNSQPIFYFVFNPDYKNSGATMAGLFFGMPATSPNEFMLIQMSIKSNTREAVMGEFGAFSGVSMGARDKDIREYSFEKIRTGIYRVVPKASLQSGEYCFYYAGNVVGFGFAGGKVFDFGVK